MKLSVVLKKLKMNQTQLAKALGLHFTSVSPWNKRAGGIPEKYHDKINKLLGEKPVGARPVKAKRNKKIKEPQIIQVGEIKPSSKVMIMIMDTEEAEKYAAKFISGEVG